jgi:hypothetical protein
MLRLVDDVNLRRKMGAAARIDVDRRFSTASVIEATLAVYRNSIGSQAEPNQSRA